MGDERQRRQLAILLDLFDAHDDDRVEHAVLSASSRWERPVDAAGEALLTTLRVAGIVDVDLQAAREWTELPAGPRAAMVLLEVEHVPLRRAALLLGVEPDELAAAHEEACAAFGWEPLPVHVACAGWPTVARLYRTGTDDAAVAVRHLELCVRCGRWHVDRLDRRRHLADLVPRIGGTGLGARWDPASI